MFEIKTEKEAEDCKKKISGMFDLAKKFNLNDVLISSLSGCKRNYFDKLINFKLFSLVDFMSNNTDDFGERLGFINNIGRTLSIENHRQESSSRTAYLYNLTI